MMLMVMRVYTLPVNFVSYVSTDIQSKKIIVPWQWVVEKRN